MWIDALMKFTHTQKDPVSSLLCVDLQLYDEWSNITFSVTHKISMNEDNN